ncbi:MAG TPA: DUF3025 domain-containing protein, partial [Myxococcota bacterium]|nr:DUF3025 domain-containing protein [Myxococcota bacterium]
MDWPAARERLRHPLFAPLAPAIARLGAERWPTHAELDGLAEGITTAGGRRLRFVPPRDAAGRDRHYELHIAATG